ncbi:MAG: hypothetical protein U5L06_07935 [Rhodovibrio sp.]|nr:hypothetical protein [Rhodovibrio sp.]
MHKTRTPGPPPVNDNPGQDGDQHDGGKQQRRFRAGVRDWKRQEHRRHREYANVHHGTSIAGITD